MPGATGSSSVLGVPRISRCRSSRPSLSSSSSESESNVSASVRSSSFGAGSSDNRRRDVPFGDDAREWNDGGGDAGGHC
ncbi:metal homeostatis protein bsd2 [Alternaria alternata]|nr:metal homeostatis protein bsd2 [Alternaria alternata]